MYPSSRSRHLLPVRRLFVTALILCGSTGLIGLAPGVTYAEDPPPAKPTPGPQPPIAAPRHYGSAAKEGGVFVPSRGVSPPVQRMVNVNQLPFVSGKPKPPTQPP